MYIYLYVTVFLHINNVRQSLNGTNWFAVLNILLQRLKHHKMWLNPANRHGNVDETHMHKCRQYLYDG